MTHDHRVQFVCESCEEFNPDESPARPCEDIAVMPDGTWLCDECFAECDKLEYGFPDPQNRDENYEHPEFKDLPRPEAIVVPTLEWQAVPKRPTEGMMDAGLYQSSADTQWGDVYSMWVDMLRVAESECADADPDPRVLRDQPQVPK